MPQERKEAPRGDWASEAAWLQQVLQEERTARSFQEARVQVLRQEIGRVASLQGELETRLNEVEQHATSGLAGGSLCLGEVEKVAARAAAVVHVQIQETLRMMAEEMEGRHLAHVVSSERRITESQVDLVELCDEVKRWCESLDRGRKKEKERDAAVVDLRQALDGLRQLERRIDQLASGQQGQIDEINASMRALREQGAQQLRSRPSPEPQSYPGDASTGRSDGASTAPRRSGSLLSRTTSPTCKASGHLNRMSAGASSPLGMRSRKQQVTTAASPGSRTPMCAAGGCSVTGPPVWSRPVSPSCASMPRLPLKGLPGTCEPLPLQSPLLMSLSSAGSELLAAEELQLKTSISASVPIIPAVRATQSPLPSLRGMDLYPHLTPSVNLPIRPGGRLGDGSDRHSLR